MQPRSNTSPSDHKETDREGSAPRDCRIDAFLKPSPAFAAVQQASSVFDYDPFDIDTIHTDTYRVFQTMVEHARSEAERGDRNRFLLVLGMSGTGKTHLMRSFRRYVHEEAHGYVVYAQLNSPSEDYARYLLQQMISSLQRSYARPSGPRTGLRQLALGLAQGCGEPTKTEINNLTNSAWKTTHPKDNLTSYINALAHRLLRRGGLSSHDSDLIRVLLYALPPDEAITSCVYRYLRCDKLTDYDSALIGGVASRTDKGDPILMIRRLASLAYDTQQAPFVFMIDQVELAGSSTANLDELGRAIDTLDSIVTHVPSATAVIASLEDFYHTVRARLTRAALDRVEKSPPIQKLRLNLTYPEIQQLVGRRLAWIFEDNGAEYRTEQPVYPIPEPLLRQLTGRRPRDVLEWCHEYQMLCGIRGEITGNPDGEDDQSDLDQIAAQWQKTLQAISVREPNDATIIAALAEAARRCAEELQLDVEISPSKTNGIRVAFKRGKRNAGQVIAMTSSGYHRGAFRGQIENLRKDAAGFTPVALRTTAFPGGPSSTTALELFDHAGGRALLLDAVTKRALLALQAFKPAQPTERIVMWHRRDRPISKLPQLREIFELATLAATA
ncbi:MAG TPA: AAA family ATPase [Kofleriaceae bacterium]